MEYGDLITIEQRWDDGLLLAEQRRYFRDLTLYMHPELRLSKHNHLQSLL